MIIAILALIAVFGFWYWMFADDDRANTIETVVNAGSLVYYGFVGALVGLAIIALMLSGDPVLTLFGAFVLLFILTIARVKLGNTRRAIAE